MTDPWMSHRIDIEGDPSRYAQHEWLLTNGTGSYAMGTVPAINSRRYHALFVATTRPPVGRIAGLNQVLERLLVDPDDDGGAIQFTTCAFRAGDAVRYEPRGFDLLETFEKGLDVSWTYRAGDIELVRSLQLHWKRQAATVRYRLRGLDRGRLELHPMLTLRDFHALLQENDSTPIDVAARSTQVVVTRGGIAMCLSVAGASFEASSPSARWWHRIHYPIETQRGQADQEDWFVPGRFVVDLEGGDEHVIELAIALGEDVAAPEEDARRAHLETLQVPGDPDRRRLLAAAADDFVVDRKLGHRTLSTILAGYPWFADWGRDTFIALPGILLATGRYDEARSTLEAFAEAIDDGLVPNCFDDYDDKAAHYNTVDASLWFIHAALEYVTISGDRASWKAWLRDAVGRIIDAYIKGTSFDIAMTGDCLISAGSPSTQLTWMDAAHEGRAFTPRPGKTVEINALWHHALLGTAALIADDDARTADHYQRLGSRIRRAFNKLFWNDEVGGLYDHHYVDSSGDEHLDVSVRPNQVIAVAVAHSPLPRTKQRQVIRHVRDRLLVPWGLRTLPPDDPSYHGAYHGPAAQRDEAYHQGTVWPWLIGPYAEAVLRAGQFKEPAVAEARRAIEPLLEFMETDGLGQLNEIHEADEPHHPVGCIAQAWSVAAVLRVLHLIEMHGAVD